MSTVPTERMSFSASALRARAVRLASRIEAPAQRLDMPEPMPDAQKSCSICGASFPLKEFSYGNRDNRSYCQRCSKAERAAYVKGGREAARAFREAMRSKWKR